MNLGKRSLVILHPEKTRKRRKRKRTVLKETPRKRQVKSGALLLEQHLYWCSSLNDKYLQINGLKDAKVTTSC